MGLEPIDSVFLQNSTCVILKIILLRSENHYDV